MHHASTLRVPATAIPWPRPRRHPLAPRLSTRASGIWDRASLLEVGVDEARIRVLLAEGRLVDAGRGRFADMHSDARAVRALRSGYRLTCVDAADVHGLWVPDGTGRVGVHVYRPRTVAPAPSWAVADHLWMRAWPEPDPVASVPTALAHALRCQDPETVAILTESALHREAIGAAELQAMLDGSPLHLSRRIGTLSTASESGSETRVVRWLRQRGFRVEQQVFVEDVGYVDAYAGGIMIEIDGREHHSSPDAFAADRRRDLALRRLGLQGIRLSYGQVWHAWPQTQAALLEMIAHVGRQGRRALARAVVAG